MLSSRMALVVVLAVVSRVEVAFGEAPPAATRLETLSKLEALVSSMADGQGASRPIPTMASDDVVILEDMDHRRLSPSCNCDSYENGANANNAKCFKAEGGQNKCRAGLCPSDYTQCTNSPTPQASPNALVEEVAADTTTYVNAYLQVAPAGLAPAQLPPASAFAAFLAQATRSKASHVQVSTSEGVSAQTRLAKGRALAPSATTVHATIHVKTQKHKNEVVAILRDLHSMSVEGAAYSVLNVNIEPAVPYPLVCTAEEEKEKDESAALLQRLVELKEQELQLLRNALEGGSNRCDPVAINSLSAQLGASPGLTPMPLV